MITLLTLIFSISSLACSSLRPVPELKLLVEGKPLGPEIYDCKKVACLCSDGFILEESKLVTDRKGNISLVVDEAKKAAGDEKRKKIQEEQRAERDELAAIKRKFMSDEALTPQEERRLWKKILQLIAD